ncbi:MAG: hypothetical protein AMJ79_03475 [Phycisphaerae bacterium SM23_30]|nr:MAG: hypothetical protein AMJ79_03475 [Phycisphaerae bacterium SM23_30]
MYHQKDNRQSRRQWLRSLARGGLLAGISVIGISAATKKQHLPLEEKCTRRCLCRNCAVLNRCRLPQALSLKQALTKK